jgi:hypothetical protein
MTKKTEPVVEEGTPEDITYDFLSAYDELADAVLENTEPNTQDNMEMSNAELTEQILELTGWESFDLLSSFDFDNIYQRGSMNQLLAYFYVAHLRYELFNAADHNDVGDSLLNRAALAYSEYWYLMLRDKYDSMYMGIETKHSWKN